MLSENQIKALRDVRDWSGDVCGPAPGSQTDGHSVTAKDRNDLLARGLLEAIPADIPEDSMIFDEGANAVVRAAEAPFILTHIYRITEAGRAALRESG